VTKRLSKAILSHFYMSRTRDVVSGAEDAPANHEKSRNSQLKNNNHNKVLLLLQRSSTTSRNK
jgi:hypothetical protein